MKISLIGFMGSGKTSVGEILAKKLGYDMLEMDLEILKISDSDDINGIFASKGELHFRELEIKAAKKLVNKNNIVISTGGGVVMNKIILDYLHENNGSIIFLNTSFNEIQKRLEGDDSRPLFKDKLTAKALYNFRQALYEEYSDYTINTDGKNVVEIVDEILVLINS